MFKFLVELGTALAEAGQDGFAADDLISLLPLAGEAMRATQGAVEILEEMRDLDDAEAQQLLAIVEEVLERRGQGELAPGKAMAIARAAWRLIPPLLELWRQIRS